MASIVQFDDAFAAWIQTFANPALTTYMRAITTIGAPIIVLPVTMLLACLSLRYGDRLSAAQFGFSVPVGILLNTTLKNLFERARPDFWPPLVHTVGYSFPSGHTTAITLLVGCFAYIACRRLTSLAARIAVVAASFLLVEAVALSRVYLGVHYLSDVLAAQFVAMLWLTVSLAALEVLYRGKYGPHQLTRRGGERQ